MTTTCGVRKTDEKRSVTRKPMRENENKSRSLGYNNCISSYVYQYNECLDIVQQMDKCVTTIRFNVQ